MYRHEDKCRGFGDVFGAFIIETPFKDEARIRPYAISDGKTYESISYCPFCGKSLIRDERRGIMGHDEC